MILHPDLHPDPSEFRRLSGLPEDRRRALLLHAGDCTPCRALLAASDPTAIFALLALQPIPEFSLARLSRDIDAAIEAEPSAAPPAWRAVASLAASLMLAAFFGYQALQDGPARVVANADRGGAPRAGYRDAGGRFPALPAFSGTPERGLELISSPGQAEVVDFSVGEVQVVMIFDKALDI